MHVYSMNRPRYYQAMEQQFLLNNQRPPRAQYNVGESSSLHRSWSR